MVVEEPPEKSEESVLKAGLLSPLKTWPQVVFIRMANSYLKEWHSGTCPTGQALPSISVGLLRAVELYHVQVPGGKRFPRSRRCGWN